ncbi:MAG: aminotransferase class I/II-fold pyridoxal phosphate-dependent enzyme, partial [SAR202 cluster bacterium]|nr:aminotransferase class I/II-fold pyridoxal phosphate-dependent enzyme [SAR202 cluster bacterium]
MEVPYANLKRVYNNSKKELDKALQDCIDNSWFIKGPKVIEFENNLKNYCKASAVGVSSGTSALLLAYECLNLKPGDKIAMPSFTFISTPEMASKLGLEIVWIDCNLDNYTINTDYLAGIISSAKDIKAIVGLDLFGNTCDWDTIKKIAVNIPVVLDAAQSFG